MANNLLNMTVNNPIFVFVVLTIIWFLPGIIIRRISAKKLEESRKINQAKAIAKLYPKEK